jgi:hypothetical protein
MASLVKQPSLFPILLVNFIGTLGFSKITAFANWYYNKGEWKEKKIAPDKWKFIYNTNKRRAWQAPEGSGVPVGSEYHWYILAHQNVRKLDTNSYMTSMTGLKYKLAHK